MHSARERAVVFQTFARRYENSAGGRIPLPDSALWVITVIEKDVYAAEHLQDTYLTLFLDYLMIISTIFAMLLYIITLSYLVVKYYCILSYFC